MVGSFFGGIEDVLSSPKRLHDVFKGNNNYLRPIGPLMLAANGGIWMTRRILRDPLHYWTA